MTNLLVYKNQIEYCVSVGIYHDIFDQRYSFVIDLADVDLRFLWLVCELYRPYFLETFLISLTIYYLS